MTEKEAYKILGICTGAGRDEIKKRYRYLIQQVHPDITSGDGERYLNEAQKINQAYNVLKKGKSPNFRSEFREKERPDETDGKWSAPVNEYAYCAREIFCHAEDIEGTSLGKFCIARGKYLWTTDEDFPLFLFSIYQCGRQLLEEIDQELQRPENTDRQRRAQTELTYLLAQQYIDAGTLLKELAAEKKDAKGHSIFCLPAMLELSESAAEPAAGEMLCPSAIRQHRLYLADQEGKELGYLSFPDDRFYYIVVPLFEQRRVQVRILVSKKQPERKRRGSGGYKHLHLWLKLHSRNADNVPENLNLQISQLLKTYRE